MQEASQKKQGLEIVGEEQADHRTTEIAGASVALLSSLELPPNWSQSNAEQ